MLVVARYDEDVAWAARYPRRVVYNKGDRAGLPPQLLPDTVDLPNVGREAHTYLHHIVTHYDELDDVTVFAQGRWRDHYPATTLDALFDLPPDARVSANCVDSRPWGQLARHPAFNWPHHPTPDRPIAPTPLREDLGPWYERVFGEPFDPRETRVYWGAVFSVRREAVRRWPRALYESLLREVSGDANPIAAYFMERLWYSMFA